jgi:excisionase family DNA binding protein
MENNIAVITVPLSEWSEVKNQLANIAKSLLEIKGKEKSEFLTPKEVCELLKCSRNTFQSYIDKGFLEPIRMKSEKYSKLLIKRVDVDYILTGRVETNPN